MKEMITQLKGLWKDHKKACIVGIVLAIIILSAIF